MNVHCANDFLMVPSNLVQLESNPATSVSRNYRDLSAFIVDRDSKIVGGQISRR